MFSQNRKTVQLGQQIFKKFIKSLTLKYLSTLMVASTYLLLICLLLSRCELEDETIVRILLVAKVDVNEISLKNYIPPLILAVEKVII